MSYVTPKTTPVVGLQRVSPNVPAASHFRPAGIDLNTHSGFRRDFRSRDGCRPRAVATVDFTYDAKPRCDRNRNAAPYSSTSFCDEQSRVGDSKYAETQVTHQVKRPFVFEASTVLKRLIEFVPMPSA